MKYVKTTPELVDQPTSEPTEKIKAVGAAGVVIAAIVTVLALFGVIIPDELSKQASEALTALIVLITFGQATAQFVAGYIKKNKVV